MLPSMAVGRAQRFEERKPRVTATFGDDNKTLRLVYEVFELMEMAWRDCHAEITPPEEVVDNVLLCSGGTLDGLIHAAHLAVIDSRDLAVWASDVRSNSGGSS
jgi:hypothetical protein